MGTVEQSQWYCPTKHAFLWGYLAQDQGSKITQLTMHQRIQWIHIRIDQLMYMYHWCDLASLLLTQIIPNENIHMYMYTVASCNKQMWLLIVCIIIQCTLMVCAKFTLLRERKPFPIAMLHFRYMHLHVPVVQVLIASLHYLYLLWLARNNFGFGSVATQLKIAQSTEYHI